MAHAPRELKSTLAAFSSSSNSFELPDIVPNAVVFAQEWWTWWCSVQPVWRLPQETKAKARIPKLKRATEKGEMLHSLRRTGKEGLFSVLLGLGLWVCATEHSPQSLRSLSAAINDVSWVLSIFTNEEPSRTAKRAAYAEEEVPEEKGPEKK